MGSRTNDRRGIYWFPMGPKTRACCGTVYYEPETSHRKGLPDRDFALQLAKTGLCHALIGYTPNKRKMNHISCNYPHIGQCHGTAPWSMLALRLQPPTPWQLLPDSEVNCGQEGITGHFHNGGKWAMFASCYV